MSKSQDDSMSKVVQNVIWMSESQYSWADKEPIFITTISAVDPSASMYMLAHNIVDYKQNLVFGLITIDTTWFIAGSHWSYGFPWGISLDPHLFFLLVTGVVLPSLP